MDGFFTDSPPQDAALGQVEKGHGWLFPRIARRRMRRLAKWKKAMDGFFDG